MQAKTMIKLILILFFAAMLLNEGMAQQEPQKPSEQGMNPENAPRKEFSNTELEQFIEANKQAIVVQQNAEQKMIKAIQDRGLDIETFNDILTSKQDPNHTSSASIEDQSKFDSVVVDVVKIQEDMMTEMESAIEKSGITIETYEQILIAYQENPELQEKINNMLKTPED